MPRAQRSQRPSPSRTVLIVEDDSSLRSSLHRYLRRSSVVLEAATCAEAFQHIDQSRIDVMLVDIMLPDGQGFELSDRAARLRPRPGVIIMTGDDRMDHAIAALQHGAADFLLKPFSFEALDQAIARVERRNDVPVAPEGEASDNLTPAAWRDRFAPDILGDDPKLLKVFGVLQRVADTDVSVLITGPSGTGKELIAHALVASNRAQGRPFVAVNCAAIPETLLESELFGHVRGAFTGATENRKGRFESADGGAIFLDEIGELPLPLQAKILRVLQEKEVTPIGSSSSKKVEVRVIAATNRDLEEMVEAGGFREDLLYRLNVIPVELPALRERRSDVPQLVRHFIERANERRSRHISGIEDDALELLVAYDWPGNVRQLENTVERMVVLKSDGALTLADLPPKIRATNPDRIYAPMIPKLPVEGLDLQRAVDSFENALMTQALERTGWNKNRAAKLLRMNRTTLVEKLKKKGLKQPE
jgi:DNA-binding NtrC family response regulator